MNATATWREMGEHNRSGLIVSVIGHLLLLAIISANVTLIPKRPMPQLAIRFRLIIAVEP